MFQKAGRFSASKPKTSRRKRTFHINMLTITEWSKRITSLGLLPFFLFKIQALSSRFTQSRRPILYWTKYATFPLKARPKTTDPFVFWQIFGDREYRCLDDLRNVGLIIDCGATVGYSSAYFLTPLPTSHVIAVEPDIDNFDLLRTNLAPYGDRCHLVNSPFDRSLRDWCSWSRHSKLPPTAIR